MATMMYYATLATVLVPSLIQALDLSIPTIRTNTVDNLIRDLVTLQGDIELYANVIPDAEESFLHVQDVINAAINEQSGIYGDGFTPSDDLISAAKTIYDTLAAFDPQVNTQATTENYIFKDQSELRKLNEDLQASQQAYVLDQIRGLGTQMAQHVQDNPDLFSEYQDIFPSAYGSYSNNPSTMKDNYPSRDWTSNILASGQSATGNQDSNAGLFGDMSLFNHQIGPLDFGLPPTLDNPSGAMEEEIVDTVSAGVQPSLDSNAPISGVQPGKTRRPNRRIKDDLTFGVNPDYKTADNVEDRRIARALKRKERSPRQGDQQDSNTASKRRWDFKA
ncbi:hypothetical protein TWF281_005332 [Arthrobotrys megalospora]